MAFYTGNKIPIPETPMQRVACHAPSSSTKSGRRSRPGSAETLNPEPASTVEEHVRLHDAESNSSSCKTLKSQRLPEAAMIDSQLHWHRKRSEADGTEDYNRKHRRGACPSSTVIMTEIEDDGEDDGKKRESTGGKIRGKPRAPGLGERAGRPFGSTKEAPPSGSLA